MKAFLLSVVVVELYLILGDVTGQERQEKQAILDTMLDPGTDCYLQSLDDNVTTRLSFLREGRSERDEQERVCRPGYFRLPDESYREEVTVEETEYLRKFRQEGGTYENLIVCCPKVKHQDERGFSFRPVFWPSEKKGTLSRAFMECHPVDLPGVDSIRYYLYTTQKGSEMFNYHELDLDSPATFVTSGFLKKAPVKIIIHGFMSSGFIGPAPFLRSAYMTVNQRMNVIAVNWESLANLATASGGICYDVASQSTKLVGQKTARFIEYLVRHGYTTLDKVHVMGHSLGAHCAGFAGKFMTIGKIPRITGFDPARPQFDDKGPRDRLDYTDADFVDVIHTATTQWKLLGYISGGLLPFPVGMRTPIGHRDFYPNRGTHQPGCYLQLRKLPVLCSHSRSYVYYGESIRYRSQKAFIADKCKSLEDLEEGSCASVNSGSRYVNISQKPPANLLMGEFTSTTPEATRSMYYVKTDYQSPFALDDVLVG